MTWKTCSSRVVSRPATAMTVRQVSQPAIQSAALRTEGSGRRSPSRLVGWARTDTGLASVEHVVHVEITLVERPGPAQWIVDHAHDLPGVDAACAQTAH